LDDHEADQACIYCESTKAERQDITRRWTTKTRHGPGSLSPGCDFCMDPLHLLLRYYCFSRILHTVQPTARAFGRVMDVLLRETFNDAIKEDQAHGRDRIQAEVARHLGAGVFRFFTRNPRADGKPRFTSLRGSLSESSPVTSQLVPTGAMVWFTGQRSENF